jgi:hypothetical protein
MSKHIEMHIGLYWYSDSRVTICEALKFHGHVSPWKTDYFHTHS